MTTIERLQEDVEQLRKKAKNLGDAFDIADQVSLFNQQARNNERISKADMQKKIAMWFYNGEELLLVVNCSLSIREAKALRDFLINSFSEDQK